MWGVGCRVKGHGGGWWRRRWEWRGWWGRGWWWREVVGEGMVVGGGVESKAPEKGGVADIPHRQTGKFILTNWAMMMSVPTTTRRTR